MMPSAVSATRLALLLAAALSFVVLLATSAHAILAWRRAPNSPIAAMRHDDFFFYGSETGWIIHVGGQVSKTTDSGETWSLAATINTSARLRCVGFATAERGWIGVLGDCGTIGVGDAFLYETTDGGTAWTAVTNVPEPKPDGLCGIWVVNESVVYACGRYCSTPRVIKTTDAGASWTTIDMSTYADGLVDCRFFDEQTGIVVGRLVDDGSGLPRGVILATTDGGATWTTKLVTTDEDRFCWKISFPTREVGYVSVQHAIAAQEMVVLKTTDGGVTWEEKPFPVPDYNFMQGIGFATPDIGWVGGMITTYGTTDGGLTWQPDDLGAGDDYANRFRFFHGTFGYAVGKRLFRYSDDAAVGVPEARPALALASPEPNPNRGLASVTFSLPERGSVRLALFEASGRLARELLAGTRPAGPQALTFDLSGLASGVYFLRLEAGDRVEKRKVQIVR
jgi:photosystem II stability/assembly factor-like uncharacterized protein